LERRFGILLPAALVGQRPSIRKIARFIVEHSGHSV